MSLSLKGQKMVKKKTNGLYSCTTIVKVYIRGFSQRTIKNKPEDANALLYPWSPVEHIVKSEYMVLPSFCLEKLELL